MTPSEWALATPPFTAQKRPRRERRGMTGGETQRGATARDSIELGSGRPAAEAPGHVGEAAPEQMVEELAGRPMTGAVRAVFVAAAVDRHAARAEPAPEPSALHRRRVHREPLSLHSRGAALPARLSRPAGEPEGRRRPAALVRLGARRALPRRCSAGSLIRRRASSRRAGNTTRRRSPKRSPACCGSS